MMLRNPFPGIRPFKEEESEFFFGREKQINDLEIKLQHVKFVAVVGLSASGKSSLVSAGLIPKLKKTKEWDICVMRPQTNPIKNLATALGEQTNKYKPNSENETAWKEFIYSNLIYNSLGIIETYKQCGNHKKLLLVIDQFEELITYSKLGNDKTDASFEDESFKFVNLLITTLEKENNDIYILITIRSDFIGDCSKFRGLPELINDGQFLVPRLTRNELKQAISEPLNRQNVALSPLLLNTLLNDINEDPDQLPVLQHSLMRTWNYWRENDPDSKEIKVYSYESIGKMDKCVGRHADEIFEKLSISDKLKMESLFKQIATSEKGKFFRRPANAIELSGLLDITLDELNALTTPFRKEGVNFLLPPEGPILENSSIDVAHEAFIRKWGKFESWIEDERKDVEILNKLFDNYETQNKDRSEILGVDFLSEVKANKRLKELVSRNGKKEKAELWVIRNLDEDSRELLKITDNDLVSNFTNFTRKTIRNLFWRKYSKTISLAIIIVITILIGLFFNEQNTKAQISELNFKNSESKRLYDSISNDAIISKNIDSLNNLRNKITQLSQLIESNNIENENFKNSNINLQVRIKDLEVKIKDVDKSYKGKEDEVQSERSKYMPTINRLNNEIAEWKKVVDYHIEKNRSDGLKDFLEIDSLKKVIAALEKKNE